MGEVFSYLQDKAPSLSFEIHGDTIANSQSGDSLELKEEKMTECHSSQEIEPDRASEIGDDSLALFNILSDIADTCLATRQQPTPTPAIQSVECCKVTSEVPHPTSATTLSVLKGDGCRQTEDLSFVAKESKTKASHEHSSTFDSVSEQTLAKHQSLGSISSDRDVFLIARRGSSASGKSMSSLSSFQVKGRNTHLSVPENLPWQYNEYLKDRAGSSHSLEAYSSSASSNVASHVTHDFKQSNGRDSPIRNRCSFYEAIEGVSVLNHDKSVPLEGKHGPSVDEFGINASDPANSLVSKAEGWLLETCGSSQPRQARQWLLGHDIYGFQSSDPNATFYREHFYKQGHGLFMFYFV